MPCATPDQIRQVFAKHPDIAEQLISGSRQAVAILREHADDDQIPIGASKLGGRPDLPDRAPWPAHHDRPLAFLAQIALADVPVTEGGTDLPRSGLLLFFYDWAEQPWGFDPKDKGKAQVVYAPAGTTLKRADPPPGTYAPEPDNDSPFPSCAVRFDVVYTYPDPGNEVYMLDDELSDLYLQTLHAGQGDDDEPHHQLRGLPLVIQNPMEIECQLVSNGIYCGGERSTEDEQRIAALEPGAEDWTLLLQLDSDDSAGWMWGDVGVLYFWIRRQDLAASDFTSVWCILQCT